jgi:hypothetical protein
VTETSVSEASKTEFAFQRVVPRCLFISSQGHIFGMNDFKSGFLKRKLTFYQFYQGEAYLCCLQHFFDGFDIGKTVTLHNAHFNIVMLLVVRIVLVGHYPFQIRKASTRLENSKELFVHYDLLRGMFNRLEGETGIQAVILCGNVMEVALIIR